jgi:hypothetical protein
MYCAPALWMFELQNFALMEEMKQDHKIQDTDYKFTLLVIWNKCLKIS